MKLNTIPSQQARYCSPHFGNGNKRNITPAKAAELAVGVPGGVGVIVGGIELFTQATSRATDPKSYLEGLAWAIGGAVLVGISRLIKKRTGIS